jgi:Flp pilus assembly protein CpaB
MPSFLVDLLARLNRWPRRLAALGCVLLAVASAVAARRADAVREPVGASGTRVVVAALDLPVGTALARRDLTTVAWPRALVPAGVSSDPDRLVGRRLAGPLRKREAVTATRLVGTDLTAGLAVGDVATAVPINAGLATVVHAGDRVDILAGPSDDAKSAGLTADPTVGAVLVAEAAAILAVLPATDADGVPGAAQVLVVTDRGTAVRLVALQGRRVLAVVLSPP